MRIFSENNSNLLIGIHPRFEASGRNLLHYLALRQIDLKRLQLRLAHFGLSSLGRCESCVMHNIEQVNERINDTLNALQRRFKKSTKNRLESLTWFEAEKLLHRNTQDLFGPKPKDRHVYILVTAPSRGDFREEWVRAIIQSGANLIRINCAHGCRADWEEMVSIIRRVATELNRPCRILMDLGGPKIRTILEKSKNISVGDQVTLTSKRLKKNTAIQCSMPEALKYIKVGDRVFFDDGKIESKVVERNSDGLVLNIRRVHAPKTKLKNEKGINFPDSHVKVSEVTPQDLQDLDFVASNADLVGLSFVQSAQAIRKIRRELKRRTNHLPGIVLKIETQAGFESLPKLLIEAMKGYPCGVMIARGDLGVEVGFERMVEVQEEILWLCEAAHVPVIWATQVLENATKSGQASRAEVTDAASAVRAECVMLNKGPFVDSATRSLDSILKRMEFHTYKKRNLYRQLKVARIFE